MPRLDHLKRSYRLLITLEERLAGTRQLYNYSGRMPWPKRSVYFFWEAGEVAPTAAPNHESSESAHTP